MFPDAQTVDIENGHVKHPVDVVHICFPPSPKFVRDVRAYIKKYGSKHTVIYSTVPIGTTKKITGAVHSPVEGRHPELASSMRIMPRWIGYNDREEGVFFSELFANLEMETKLVADSDQTEFLKLRSTAKYGINLVWTDYEKAVADDLDMDFRLVQEFDTDYNQLYRDLNMDWVKRYILEPPKGKIGGHCVVPNAQILNDRYPNKLLDMIEDMK